MYWFTRAFILLCAIYLCEAGYGSQIYRGDTPDSEVEQSDVQAPAYVPPYLRNRQYTKTGSHGYQGTKTYSGTKTYGGTKTAYSGTKTSYSGTKNAYGGTNNVYSQTGAPSRYSETRQWNTESNAKPSYNVFVNNANQPYQPKCSPECKNSGICVDTNTCQCPANFHGKFCEFEKKPCLNYPPLPMNSMRKCSSEQCTITCMEGHKFIDGSTVANMRCLDGQWTPSRADFSTIPDCEPECDPPCLNGGVCLALNTCSCPAAYRGPQCQYSVSVCDVRKLAYNGGYKCFGDGEKFSCRLTCPAGATYSSPPAPLYSCRYDEGIFQPQPIPHCVFTDVVVIQPTNTYNNSYYSIHTEADSSREETSISSQHSHSHGHHGISMGGSVKVVVQDLVPKGGTCLTWAGVHYKTFDGKLYTFQSPCQHTLVRESKEHKYTVAIQHKTCKRQGYCPSELTVYLEDKPYMLATGEDGSVIFRSTKRLIPIPASLPGIRVSMPSDYVLINLDAAGVTIKWDTNNLVQIEGSVLLWNNTEGLCGTLDGNPENDLTTKDRTVVKSISVLASSWQINKIGDICEATPSETAPCASETAADVTKATKFCNDMISMKKFRKCSKAMDVLQFLETCKWDYCACASTLNSQECACRAISVYAKECLRHGVEEMKNWRDADTCPMTCPEGRLYKACGPDAQPSCAFPQAPARSDNSTCVEGCFCPEGLLLEAGKCVPKQQCPCRLRNKSFPPGSVINKDCNTCTCEGGEWRCTSVACGARCRAVGDPHYTTFDGLRYDFMGRCTYTMLQAGNLTVEVENVACSGSISESMNLTPVKTEGKPSCTKAVTINYDGASIHLKQGGTISVNGKEVTSIPVMVGDIRIRAASSLFLIVQLPNKVDLWWDGNTRVFIDVPPQFQGKTKGLCGTFNLNQKDDFLTPENDIEQSTSAFANKWRTREFCDADAAPEPEHPCRANVANKEAAQNYCAKLKSNVFEACHWHVDVEPYYEACLYDMCACETDISRCLCPTLGDYAMSCAKAGVMLQWRYNVQECELQCSGGQEYTVCADSCLRKCSDTALSAQCSRSCVEGCACPQGQLLDDNGVCVPVALCPCFHKGLQFNAGYKEVRAGRRERELCVCVGARWDCVPATPEDIKNYPPAEDLRSNCSATNNMEFTTCALAEPLTCKNMHLPPTSTSAECRPGCQCKRGYVLDTSSKQCVQATQCPCHHAGRSYPDGHAMQEECNECACKQGNWTCTTKKCAGVCAAWGDSHIGTFDGTDYDFEGVCTYLLAKGNVDGNDGFDVEIQNVPCGTTGATCSKSITLKVGRGGNEEVVSLTKNAPLPDVSKLKRIKLRIAGAYVFLDVPSLGASVQWDRQMRVYVKVDAMWQGRVKGLCGNYNGDMRDDFQTPSGGLAESSALIFADSWKLKSTCPKAQAVQDHCKQRPERKEWAATTCSALKRYPFTLCHGEVPPAPWAGRCERDACACDAGGDCECACAALAAYAYACAHRGITFGWRTQELCPMQCDEQCSNYDGCVSACPVETCDNTLRYADIKGNCEEDTCVEGCKPKTSCSEGTVYSNSSSSLCVPRAQCRPACTLPDGTEVPEGGVVSADDCHACRCSNHELVCRGEPCTTPPVLEETSPEPSSVRPHDEPLKCATGWTPWVSRGTPEAESNGETLEVEPLPQPNELPIGSPMCKPEMMTDIECRTIDTKQSAKETGLNAECSLERGLVCKEKEVLCPDFEIRVHCQCEEENPCQNITAPNTKHPTDCAKFYECSPSGPALKECGPGTLYNPDKFVCDWPVDVVLVRPECGSTTQAPLSPSTTTPAPTERSRCAPGEEFRDCAFPCDKLCDHFKRTLMQTGRCIRENCVEGCVKQDLTCGSGTFWRDEQSCVKKEDCTCLSDGKTIKPGGTVVDGCLHCQCLNNDFHCDSTACVSVVSPAPGSTHQPYVMPVVTETTPTSAQPPASPTTHTMPSTSGTPTTPTTPLIIVPLSKEPRVLGTTTTPPTTALPIIVKSTATPPPECAPDNFMNLMWGDEPLPDSAFSASSFSGELFKPQYAVLDGHPLDYSAGSWNPAVSDDHQYIQVELPQREPIYGVKVQGSPLFNQYVTSFSLLYGDDGVTFSNVNDADGKIKVFRGPVEHKVAVTQMLVPPIEAKYVRLQPLTWHDEIAVRMELIGCREQTTTVTTTPLPTTESPQCEEPLGLAADLPLDSITVSSSPEDREYLAMDAPRGWRPLYSTPGEWVMFNFTSPRNITGIKTKGGEKGWVTTYQIMYTCDLDTFSPVMDKNRKVIDFPGNFDTSSVMEHAFRPPLRAQYLKVLPIKWKDNVEMRVEPIGCFEPYPATTPTPATEPTTPPPCQLCPGTVPPEAGCVCAGTAYYDGEGCVPRAQCPCVLSFLSYAVGSTFRGANCDECMCKLGGIMDCKPVKKCECNNAEVNGDVSNLVPKLVTSTCECTCEPCPRGTRLCRTSQLCLADEKWCDGVTDCPDDEIDCAKPTEPALVTEHEATLAVTQPTTVITTTPKPVECPVVSCPPGYHVVYTSTRPSNPWSGSDLPPPRPRYSYTRYIKGGRKGYGGTKGGFSKGGFSKGGFSKGGYVPPPPPQNTQAFTLAQPAAAPAPAPAEACRQFKCVPRVPPFPRPGSTPAPVVCSVVSCPRGYTLKLETLPSGFNRCPQYECVPPAERPVYCNVTGRTFATFDGSEYKYDICFHILARENRLNAWTVLIRKKCRETGCWNELMVHQDDQLILVKPNLMIEYNNYEYTVEQTTKICFQKNSFDVARVGNGVLVKSRKYNFTVLYNQEGDVKIGVLKSLKGAVDGLCGLFDGDASNDRRLPNGRPASSVDQFGRAWAKPGLRPDACEQRAAAAAKQKRVWGLCDVITKEPLSRCGSVLNLDKWRHICLEKICSCSELVVNGTKRTEEQCRCLFLEQMVAECLAADKDKDVADWRVANDCPAECPAPLVHYDCYRKRCAPTCAAAGASCPVEEGQCFPGCYCPEGKLRQGDACVLPADCLDCTCNGVGTPAKYVTFEGDELPFLGNCTYLASRDRNETGQHLYQVFATNGPCEENPSTSCAKSIHLVYEKNVIHITKDDATKKLVTTIGSNPVFKYPVKKEWGTITLDNGQDISISLPDIHVELTVLQSKLEFTVRAPSSLYANRTEGLCGVCAGYQEFLVTSNGTATDDFDEYGKSWQATPEALTTLDIPAQEQCDAPPPPEECVPPPAETNPCYNLYNADRFGACRALVDPQPFVESCEADLCANVTDVCATLERYAAACRRQGVCLDKWRGDLCPYPCESPLVYRACVACDLTCENKEALSAAPDKCGKQPLEGCFCPEGKVRVNNTCIAPEKCFPCDANKEHYAGDQWQESACTACTCSKAAGERAAHVSCTTESCTTPACAAGEHMLTSPPRAAACCPTYVCVPKPKAKECPEPKKMECGYGQVLKQKTGKDECPEFSCECKPTSECEDIPPESDVEMLEPGMQRLVDLSGCCPKLQLICRTDKCPRSPACPQFHELRVRNVSGKCCPEYECEIPKDKCLVKLEWESSPSGGERARNTPEVMFKDLDAVWLDGPCRSCRCAASPGGAAAQCSETACPAAPADAHFVVTPRAVPFACCPALQRTACRLADTLYKVGENWTSPEDVCAVYTCARAGDSLEKVKTVQTCENNCQPGWRYVPATPDSKQCCGKCEPVACVVDGAERPIGDKWTSPDSCTNYTCVNVHGTLQVQSSNETCPEVPAALRKQFVLKEEKTPGKCCRSQEPVACRVGDKIYQEGQTWASADPCKNYTCARDVTSRLAHTESVQKCSEECARGWAYRRPARGACCGRCVQDACVVGDDLRKPGSTWRSADKCTSFSCERAGEEVFVTSARQACPDVSRCRPQDLVNETCCQVCKEKPESLSRCVPQSMPPAATVELVRARVGPHGLCVNKQPLRGLAECRGACDSGAVYDTMTGIHNTICECCSATQYAPLEVLLSCEDGSEQRHQLASPVKCACSPCGTASKGHWGTKSGYSGIKTATKTAPVRKQEINEEETDVIPDIFKRFGEE